MTDINEDLRKWFKEKWVRFDTKGNIKGECAKEEGEGKPKCLPMAKAHALGKEKRASAARRKRKQDPHAEREGKAKFVKTHNEEVLLEKNVPTNPTLNSSAILELSAPWFLKLERARPGRREEIETIRAST